MCAKRCSVLLLDCVWLRRNTRRKTLGSAVSSFFFCILGSCEVQYTLTQPEGAQTNTVSFVSELKQLHIHTQTHNQMHCIWMSVKKNAQTIRKIPFSDAPNSLSRLDLLLSKNTLLLFLLLFFLSRQQTIHDRRRL